MKKVFIVIVAAVLFAANVFAQTPTTMSYQAVVRNSANALVINQSVGMRISILQGTAGGTAVYTETQTTKTNANGLVSIEIGTGTGFAAINWATGPYFIKTETDPAGGTNYTITGTSQLLTVPYAKYADVAGNVKIQTLSIASRTISLSDANKITLPDSVSYAKVAGNVKLQTLSIASRTISLSDANNITLPDSVSYAKVAGNVKLQTLSIASRTISLSDANKITLPDSVSYAKVAGNVKLQTLSIASRTISLSDANKITLPDSVGYAKTAYTFHKVETKGTTLCNTENEGIMRYDNIAKTMEYCNGNNWVAIGGSFSVGLPQISTTAITIIPAVENFHPELFNSGGVVSTNGGSEIIQKGICWNTSPSPTISNYKTLDGTGSDTFISNLGALTYNHTYYYRAYATNFAGTSYGNELIFTTPAVVSTNTAASVTSTSFTTGGFIEVGGSATVERGIVYSLSATPTIADTKVALGNGTGSFTTNISGLTTNKTYYYRAYAINSAGSFYGEIKSESLYVTGTTQTDADGNVYNTVKIGTQVWMTENLKTTKLNDNTPISNITTAASWTVLTTPAYCWYNNQATATTTYGALYNWYTVNTTKLCPTGWHVPTDAEWTTLTNYLGDASIVGEKLKEAGTTHWQSPNSGATNETNFSALPGGLRFSNGSFGGNGYSCYWWSASENNSTLAWGRYMHSNGSFVSRNDYNKVSGFSVRCVRD